MLCSSLPLTYPTSIPLPHTFSKPISPWWFWFSPMAVITPLPTLAAACSLVVVNLLLSLLSPLATAEVVLLPGGYIAAGRSLYDTNRNNRLIQQWNCDFALYDLYDVAWNTHTAGNGSYCRTTLTADGQLRVLRGDGKVLWASPKWEVLRRHYVLALQPDRNVVIYSQLAWAADTELPGPHKYQFNDQVLMANDTILFGKYLSNLDLNYQFLLQENCDMVLYDKSKRIWSTGTAGKGTGCTATLSTDGHLLIRDGDGKTVWKSVNHEPYPDNYALVLQPDRNIALATGLVWSTGTKVPGENLRPSSDAAGGSLVE